MFVPAAHGLEHRRGDDPRRASPGLLFHDWIEHQARNPLLIAGTTFFYGLLLFVADRVGRKERELIDLGLRDALIIGMRAGAGPGARHLALRDHHHRRPAARLHPAGGRELHLPPRRARSACWRPAKEAKDLLEVGRRAATTSRMMGIGVVVSAVVGYAVIAWLLDWLRRRSLNVFVVYRVLLAAVILAASLSAREDGEFILTSAYELA